MYNRIHFLNTFTANGSGGNPTAVYFSRRFIENDAMQFMAKELNVPVTAFVWEQSAGIQIRYFTAQCEIAACGHATLGAAAVAAEALQTTTVCFETVSGTGICAKVMGGNVRMLYASRSLEPAVAETALLRHLKLTHSDVAAAYRYGNTLVAVLPAADDVRNLQPDIPRLQRSSTAWD